MGESSTCLVRSSSTPVETNEGNPLRALGESISFGRFMTETLDWEKWSTFTQKRYVEEAERYSKPGSVAAKKAYFEAHYKRKAAEKAAALSQEENVKADETFDSENLEGNCIDSSIKMNSEAGNIDTAKQQMNKVTVDGTFDSENPEGNCTDSSIQMKSEEDNIEVANEQMNKYTVDCQVVDCDGTNQYKCDVGQSDLDVPEVEGPMDVPHPCNDTNINVLSCVLVDSNQLDHVEDKNIVIPIEERVPDLDIAGQEILALPVKGREVNSSLKSSAKTRATKLSHSRDEKKANAAVPPRNGLNSGVKAKNTIGDAVEKKRLATLSLRMSVNLPSGIGETNKTAAAGLQIRNGLNSFSTSKKSIGGLVEKKRLTASSLHMSIDVPSGTGVASKTTATAVKPSNRVNIARKSMKSVGASTEKKPTARSPHMSISLPSGAGQTSKTSPGFEHNSDKKVSCNLPKDHPVLKTSTTTKIIPQAPTIASPFRFRSEERAIKRKELLQKMVETKSKEEKKVQLQRISKGKTELDHKKLQHSSSFKSKLNEDRQSGSHSPSNQIKKISLTVPQSPKPVRKASCSTVRDKNLGNSQKPPISTNNSKRIIEKINRTRQSGTSLSNTTRENASPNIQN